MEKRWVVKEKGDTAVVKQLAGALGVSESLANLMAQRNKHLPLKQPPSLIQVLITSMIRS